KYGPYLFKSIIHENILEHFITHKKDLKVGGGLINDYNQMLFKKYEGNDKLIEKYLLVNKK
ncbi:MAG: hypothetical protein MJ252_13810, partial [archaeon]|nr:hypothetical protein [archaeon]